MKTKFVLILILYFFFNKDIYPSNKIIVLSSILPYSSLIKDIGGELVDSRVIIESFIDPHNFELKPHNINDIKQTNIYFFSNLEFEVDLIKRIQNLNEDLKIIFLNEIQDLRIRNINNLNKFVFDPHTYTSPKFLAKHAKIIYDELINHDLNIDKLKSNFNQLMDRINRLSTEVETKLASHKNETIYSFHSITNHLSNQYNIKEVWLTPTDHLPGPKTVNQFKDQLILNNVENIIINEHSQEVSLNKLLNNQEINYILIPHFTDNWHTTITEIINGYVKALK